MRKLDDARQVSLKHVFAPGMHDEGFRVLCQKTSAGGVSVFALSLPSFSFPDGSGADGILKKLYIHSD